MTTPKSSGPKGAGQAAALPAVVAIPRNPAFELGCLADQVSGLAFTTYGCGAESFQRMAQEHRRALMNVLHKLALKMPDLADEVATRPGTSASDGSALRTAVDELVALTANLSGARFDDFESCNAEAQDSVLLLVSDTAADLSGMAHGV